MSRTKEEAREYARIYRIGHREQLRVKAKAYAMSHPERIAAYSKAYADSHRELKRAHDAAHKEEYAIRHRAYTVAHREESRNRHLFRNHGLSKEGFDSMLADQGGSCAICRKTDFPVLGPCVDHDHVTGKVRGILCHKCNSAVAYIGDDPKIALSMADYLAIKSQAIFPGHGDG